MARDQLGDWRSPSSTARGFTLLEVLIGATILVLVVASTFVVFTAGERFIREAMHRREALGFAQQVLEELRDDGAATTWASVAPSDPLSAGLHTAATNAFLTLPAGAFRDRWNGVRQYQVDDLDLDGLLLGTPDGEADVKRVTVTVTWDEPPL